MNRFFQALIALSGLLITGLLGYQTATNTERQTELAQAQSRYALIALFSEQIDSAFSRCDLDPLLIATDAATELEEDHGLPQYLDYLTTARAKLDQELALCGIAVAEAEKPTGTPGPIGGVLPPDAGSGAPVIDPARPAPEPPPQQQQAVLEVNPVRNIELRQEEGMVKKGPSAQQRAQAPARERWYAVLASYKVGQEESYVVGDVEEMRSIIASSKSPDLKLEVYRTSLSDHYAIVLTPPDGSREAARDLAATARSIGLSPDSFVQDDRNWTLCQQPDSVSGLGACTRVPPPPSKR